MVLPPSNSHGEKLPMKPLPVTLLSGFLGSGKTSLLKHILKSKSSSMRVAVIVNEITSINMDAVALNGAKLLQSEEKMVEMSNGCICCTLRMDLLQQLRELHEKQAFDAVVIESSGIADPMETAETFFVQFAATEKEEALSSPASTMSSKYLQDFAPLDCCVSVVDASTLLDFMSSSDDVRMLQHASSSTTEGSSSSSVAAVVVPSEDERSISELLFGQLEFANVIVANKMDLLPPPKRDEVIALLKTINRSARIIPSSFGNVPLEQVLNTNLFNESFARSVSTNWMDDFNNPAAAPHVPETVQFHLSTCTFSSLVPFHPGRLFKWMTTYFVLNEVVATSSVAAISAAGSSPNWKSSKSAKDEARRQQYGELFRGKGTAWIGNVKRDDVFLSWSQCGSILTFASGGYWDEYPWGSYPSTSSLPHQRRKHQQLVFVGRNLNKSALLSDLSKLLLTPDEVRQLEKALGHPCGLILIDALDGSSTSDEEGDEAEEENGSDASSENNNDEEDVFEDPFEPFYASDADEEDHDDDDERPPKKLAKTDKEQ